jgi:hypothetical protein
LGYQNSQLIFHTLDAHEFGLENCDVMCAGTGRRISIVLISILRGVGEEKKGVLGVERG